MNVTVQCVKWTGAIYVYSEIVGEWLMYCPQCGSSDVTGGCEIYKGNLIKCQEDVCEWCKEYHCECED